MVNQKKILIVDDIELNRAILSELFHDTYDILEAENGLEAIKALKQYGESVIMILLDIVMPIMDGFGMLEEMAKHGWAGLIPVVMITSETSEDTMQRGYEMGVTDIITKPFAPNIIRQRIHNIVEQYTYKLNLESLVEQQMTELRNQGKKLRENSARMIDILSAVIEFKNSESVDHIHNIRRLTKIMLKKLAISSNEYEFSDELIETISEAAAMHDIGKIAIPEHILNKPGRLTGEEFEIMKTHSQRGCEILEKLSSMQYLDYYDYCYEICRHHHERWNGGGYPDGLVGDETPIWAQVVSLADVYDALTSKRVYKEAYTSTESIKMIVAGECGVFNPLLMDCFISLIPELESGAYTKVPLSPPVEEIKRSDVKLLVRTAEERAISARTLHLLELERQKYRIMSELSEEILFEYDFKTDKIIFSDKYQLITNRDPIITHSRERLYKGEFLEKSDLLRLQSSVGQMTPENPVCKLDLKIDLDGGGFEWYGMYLYPIWSTEQEHSCVGYMGKLINIQKQKQENLELKQAADNDALTGIMNRKALQRHVAEAISASGAKGALCFIDIDDFKNLNDSYGHIFGDNALKRVSRILAACTGEKDLVGRIGGDEFIVYLHEYSDRQDLERKLGVICENLSNSFDECRVSGSLGVARYPQDGETFESLMQHADQALYQAKLLGKNRYQIYEDSL